MNYSNFIKLFLSITYLLIISSCSTKKDIILIQDYENITQNKSEIVDYLISYNDILNITVTALNPEIVAPYNMAFASSISNVSTPELLKIQGYNVLNDGTIKFPVLGKIHVSGKTSSEIEEIVYKMLLEGGFLVNHSVFVKVINSRITVLGEVNVPGYFNYYENSININEALGRAGGLTINGKRNTVKLIRNIDGSKNIYNIDLTTVDYITSDFYNLRNGDIIVVEPNTTRVKNAGIIGNSGTLLSLLSFILSSIIVVNN